jgi:hypothetical protein
LSRAFFQPSFERADEETKTIFLEKGFSKYGSGSFASWLVERLTEEF